MRCWLKSFVGNTTIDTASNKVWIAQAGSAAINLTGTQVEQILGRVTHEGLRMKCVLVFRADSNVKQDGCLFIIGLVGTHSGLVVHARL